MENPSNSKTALNLDENVGAMICHLPLWLTGLFLNHIYCVIVLITDKENKFVRFCAIQSLMLLVAYSVLVPIVIIMTCGVGVIVIPVCIGLDIYLAVKANKLEKVKLPVLGDLAEQWS